MHAREPKPLATEPCCAKLMAWHSEIKDFIANLQTGVSSTSTAAAVTNCVKKIALEENILSGKWMVFESSKGDFEAKWGRVKAAVAAGDLGPVAKVSLGCSKRVMCIYTYSFKDEEDVYRVREHLQKIDVGAQSWKPDILTYLNLRSACWFRSAKPTTCVKRSLLTNLMCLLLHCI